MQREIYFQSPYKQLTLNEIQFNLQGLNAEIIDTRQSQIKSKTNNYNYRSTMESFMAGSPMKLDGQVKRINITDNEVKNAKKNHFKKFPKIYKYGYQQNKEIYQKLQQGDKIDVNFFNDVMQAKYEEKHADGYHLTNRRPKEQISDDIIQIVSKRPNNGQSKEFKMIQIQSARNQYSLPRSRGKEIKSQDQSLSDIFNNSIEKKGHQTSMDIEIYVGQNSIHIPALLGDPILYEQKKLESFRAQYRLREKFKQTKFNNGSLIIKRSEDPVFFSKEMDKQKRYSLFLDQDQTEKVQSVRVYIKNDKIKVLNPSLSLLIPQSPSRSPSNSIEKLIVSNKKGMTKTFRLKEMQQKKLLIELQKHNKIVEKKRKKQDDESNRLREIKDQEQFLIIQKLKFRNEKIQLMKQLKNMISMGESEDKVKEFKFFIDNYNPGNDIEDKQKFVDHDEILRKQYLDIKRKEINVLDHYNLISRIKNRTSDLLQKNPNQIQNYVFKNVKDCQSKILGKARHRKNISLDLQRQLQTDFNQILKTVDISISKYL